VAAKGGWLKKGYWGFVKAESFLGHFLLLMIRLYWGYLLVLSGSGKWMHIQGVIEYFGTLGIANAKIAAYSVATIELLGGVSLIFGLLTRCFSLLLSALFITAYVIAHHSALSSPASFIQEEPFLYLYAALIVLCFGPGLFSFDYWLEKKSYGESL
jgi:putative oxidoreductase